MVHSAAGLALPPGGLVSHATVPRPAPHDVDGRPGRRRLGDAATGRDQPQPRRRAVPRRARRVPARRARRAARAAGGGRHPGLPRQRPRRAAGPLPARRGHQPVPVRRRAARAGASATRSPGCATSAACRGRCSTASTCVSPCSDRRSTSCSTPAAANRARSSPGVSPPPGARRRPRRAAQRRAPRRRCSTSTRRSRAAARAVLRSEIERDRLTGRGYHRIRRVARTIADLGSARPGAPRTSSTSSTSRSPCRCARACVRPRRDWWRDDARRSGRWPRWPGST